MPVDVFDRKVSASIDEIKAALLGDVGNKKTAQKKDENTEQLKKLNDNLEKIVGNDLDRELKALNKLIKRVADCCEEQSGKRSQNLDKEAKAYAKAVAKALKPANGGDISKVIKDTFGGIKPAFDKITDKTMDFGKALERSQRRFSAAFGMIGKDFTKTFGDIGKLNPFKWFQKEGEKATKESQNMFRSGWNTTISFFKDNWQRMTTAVSSKASALWEGVTSKASALWEGVTNRVSGWWKKTTDVASDLWGKVTKRVSDSWVGKTFGFIGRSVDTLGKAVGGTVRNLLNLGKTTGTGKQKKSQSDIDDLTGKGRTVHGEGTPVGKGRKTKGAGGTSDLCRCICRCIGKLLGVTKEGVKQSKQGVKHSKDISKIGSSQLRQGAKKDMTLKPATDTGEDIRKSLEGENDRREKLERKRANWERRSQDVKGHIKTATGFLSQVMSADKGDTARVIAQGLANSISKAAGYIVGKPLEVLGGFLEKQNVEILGFGGNLAFLGAPIKFLGEALGGLAEGITSLVLQPLADEVVNFQEEMQAMYITRGATRGGRVAGGVGAPGLTGMAQGVQDWTNNIDIAAKKEEMLGRNAAEIAETGQKLSTIQKQHVKNLKMGIREEDKFNKASNIGLRASSQIGSNAEQTADMFAEWKQNLGASNVQLGMMERGLLSIARSTGIFGDNLIKVARSSQKFMEYMRMSGTFTAKASNNIVGLMAEAQKRGVSKGMENLLEVFKQSLLSPEGGGLKDFVTASIGGDEPLRERMITGTLMQDRGSQKMLAQNMSKKFNEWAADMFQGKKFDQLSIEEKGLFDVFIRQITKNQAGAEELNQLIKGMIENTKNFSESMKDLEAGAKKGKAGLTEQEKTTQRQQLIYNTSDEILEDYTRALKESTDAMGKADVGKAFEKLKESSEDLTSFYESQSIDMNKGAASIGDILRKQVEQVRKRAEKEGLTAQMIGAAGIEKEDIDNALKELEKGNTKDFEDLRAKMTALEGKTREEMRQNADPITKIQMLVFKMEGHLRLIMRTLITEIAPEIQGLMNDFDVVMDRAAKEYAKGNTEEAVKIIGDYMKKIPEDITKSREQIDKMPRASTAQKGFAGFLEGIIGKGSLGGGALEGLGTTIQKNAKEISDAIKDITEKIKMLKDNISSIAKVFGVLAAVVAGGTIAVLIMGIVAALGPMGLLGVLAGGGIAYAIWDIVQNLKEIKRIKDEERGVQAKVQQQVEATQRRNVETAADLAKRGEVELLEVQRARLKLELEQQKTALKGNEKTAKEANQAAVDGEWYLHEVFTETFTRSWGEQQAERDVTASTAKTALEHRKKEVESREKALADLEKNLAIARENAAKLPKSAERDLANWTAQWEKFFLEHKPEALSPIQQRKKKAIMISGTQWDASEAGKYGESSDEQYVRRSLAIKAPQQRLLGVTKKDIPQYKELSQILWTKGYDEAVAYVKKNAETLNMDIAQAMFDAYGEKLPADLRKKLISYEPAALANLQKAAQESGWLKKAQLGPGGKVIQKEEVLSAETFMKARELARARGAETPELADVQKVLSNPEIVQLNQKQLEYLKKMVEANDTANAIAKSKNMPISEDKAFIASPETLKKLQSIGTPTAATTSGQAPPVARGPTSEELRAMQERINGLQEQLRNKSTKFGDPNFVGPPSLEDMAKEAITPTGGGSIYTHDKRLENLAKEELKQQENSIIAKPELMGPPMTDEVKAAVNKEISVSPTLPGMSSAAEDEIRRRNAEMQNSGDVDMAKTEENTGTTAANTRAMAKMLGQIGRILTKKRSNDLGLEGPDYPVEAFFEEVLNTNWDSAGIGRSGGLEFE